MLPKSLSPHIRYTAAHNSLTTIVCIMNTLWPINKLGSICAPNLGGPLKLTRMTFQGAQVVDSISSAMEFLKELKCSGKLEHAFIIGGGQLYAEALQSPQCSVVHLTAVRILPSERTSNMNLLHSVFIGMYQSPEKLSKILPCMQPDEALSACIHRGPIQMLKVLSCAMAD